MLDYGTWYSSISRSFRKSPQRKTILVMTNRYITYLMYMVYPILLVLGLPKENGSVLLVIPALFFVLVTLLRLIWNKERPYDKFGITPIIAKETKGKSMPSRHVFSAVMISMCALTLSLPLGLLCLSLSILLALCRVIGGVHYPSDVIVGGGIGLLAGLLLFLFT